MHQKVSKMWSFPKGCKEEGECNDECWKRELEEETGIRYIPFHKVTGAVDVLKYNITMVELLTDHLPAVKITKDNAEIDQVAWVNIREAGKMSLNAVTRQVLKNHRPSDPFGSFQSCRKMVRMKNSKGGENSSSNATSRLTATRYDRFDRRLLAPVKPNPMAV